MCERVSRELNSNQEEKAKKLKLKEKGRPETERDKATYYRNWKRKCTAALQTAG
jgi:hypothetical protein